MYSISRISREFKIPENPIKNIIRYFNFKPIDQIVHAGKLSFLYRDEDVEKLKNFYFNTTRKERFKLFKEKFGKDFGPKGPSEKQKEILKLKKQKIWNLSNIKRLTGISKKGLTEWYHRGHLSLDIWENDRKLWNRNFKDRNFFF